MLPWQGQRFRVFLWRNGEWQPISHVIEADTREGWILRYATKDGQLYLDDTGEAAAKERLEGRVMIQDDGSFWKELCGALNWVLLESRFGRTILPSGVSPYKKFPNRPFARVDAERSF